MQEKNERKDPFFFFCLPRSHSDSPQDHHVETQTSCLFPNASTQTLTRIQPTRSPSSSSPPSRLFPLSHSEHFDLFFLVKERKEKKKKRKQTKNKKQNFWTKWVILGLWGIHVNDVLIQGVSSSTDLRIKRVCLQGCHLSVDHCRKQTNKSF